MAEKQRYIGVTVGPIFSTMNLVSTPAALWASSYIFSCIGKYICEELTEHCGVSREQILSPYFDPEDEAVIQNNSSGIGLYHDRVIFEAGELPIEKMAEVRQRVIERVGTAFGFASEEDKAYLREYILISAVELCTDNPIFDVGKILDSMELSCPFVTSERTNPILEKFSGGDSSRNEEIKKLARENLSIDPERWQMLAGTQIRSLEKIASSVSETGKAQKLSKYYAIVRSDGDNMSKIIGSLRDREDYIRFSKTCFLYCAAMSEKVREYRGVTIYAGGDDLLALLPCEVSLDRTLLNFVQEGNRVFADSFREYIDRIRERNLGIKDEEKTPIPTLSMGIFISYYKYPLYEALEKSAGLLFGNAKAVKNCAAIQLQKHSGQSAYLLVKSGELDGLLELQSAVLSKAKSPEKEEKFLLSALQKLELFRKLFELADDENAGRKRTADHLFANVFDAADQKLFDKDIEAIRDYFLSVDCEKGKRVDTVTSALRILKFYTEKGGEDRGSV